MIWWTTRKLRSSDWQARAEAARALAAAGRRDAVPALIKALENRIGPEAPAVIDALGDLGDNAAADALISALQDRRRGQKGRPESAGAADPAEFRSLAEALAKIGSASLKPLLGLLDSEDREVRRWAAYALGRLGDASALEPLVSMLQDPRSEVRQSAARALGNLRDRRTLQPLLKALAGRDPEVRSAAAEALGALRVEEAVEPLAAAARDPNEPLQLAAIEALRQIGGLKAGAKIRAVMETAKKSVREAAAAALGTMSFDTASPESRAAAAVLRGDFEAAWREGPAATPALASALGSRDAAFRLKAVHALHALRSGNALDVLLGALDDYDHGVQEAAAAALADFGAPAIPGLVVSLGSDHLSVRALAARSLGMIGDSRAAGPLANAVAELHGRLKNEPGAPEAARDAAHALAETLSRAAASVSGGDLARLAELAERESARSTAQLLEARSPSGQQELARAGELARRELVRRGAK